MSLPVIQPRLLLGLSIGLKGTATYVGDDEVIYPAGGVLAIHNHTQKRQRYIRLHDPSVANILCLAPNRKVVAIAEEGVEKPTISIYDLLSLKRKKFLTIPFESTAREFVAIAFTFDSRYLMAVLGPPDYLLICFLWEKSKIETTTPANYPTNPDSIVTHICCNPTDSSVVCVIGPGLFRLLAVTEGVWRQFGFQDADNMLLSYAVWITFDRVLCGTSDDTMMLIESGELKVIWKMSETSVLVLKNKDEAFAAIKPSESQSSVDLERALQEAREVNMEVRQIISFSRGFAYVSGSSNVFLYEKEGSHKYKKRNLFTVTSAEFREMPVTDLNHIQNLSINISETTLMITTERCQTYSVALWGPDLVHSPEIQFVPLGEELHYGPVKDVALCAWKPIFATAGEIDKTIRVWNYDENKLELIKEYQENILSISLHPTGLYLLVGLADLLRFTLLLIDDIQTVREFPIRNCPMCCFSTSGHLFAAVNGNVIQVYNSITFENLYNMKGHRGRVTAIRWDTSDSKIVSCGSEGAIYEWDYTLERRTNEVISLTFRYVNCVLSSDSSIFYAIDSQGEISEIQESNVLRSLRVVEEELADIVLSRSNQMLFLATSRGTVLSVRFPLTFPIEYQEYSIHRLPIVSMVMTYNDKTVITTSKDGSICIWRLAFSEGKTIKMHKKFAYSKEVLVNRRDLQEKLNEINILNTRITELVTEHAYQMRQVEAQNQERAKEVNDSYCVALEELKSKFERAEGDHTKELAQKTNENSRMVTEHGTVIENMEANFNKQLVNQYKRYEDLDKTKLDLKMSYETKIKNILAEKAQEMNHVKNELNLKIQEKTAQYEELVKQKNTQASVHEIIKNQIEEDVDLEILEMKTFYETKLTEERDMSARLNGEITVAKKKFISSQRETNEYARQMHEMAKEVAKSQTLILGLERDTYELKKEIKERDGALTDKEKKIHDLKQKNQESEKCKIVMEHKIRELKSIMEPKDREIMENREQIKDMEIELKNQLKNNTTINLQVQELRRKLRMQENEYEREHQKNRDSDALLKNIRTDLYSASGVLQDPKKLKATIKNMYLTYGEGRPGLTKSADGEEASQEFMRQRHHLEKTVDTLKFKLNKQLAQPEPKFKLLDDNISLIEEVNMLRKELKDSQHRVRNMEAILGAGGSEYIKPWVAQNRLKIAMKKKQDIVDEWKDKLATSTKNNKMLREELARLIEKMPKRLQIQHAKDESNLKRTQKFNEMKAEFEEKNKSLLQSQKL